MEGHVSPHLQFASEELHRKQRHIWFQMFLLVFKPLLFVQLFSSIYLGRICPNALVQDLDSSKQNKMLERDEVKEML